jgi:hypothetical protein
LVYERHVRLRPGVNSVAAVVGLVFVALYAVVVYLTQWPDAPSGKGAIDSADDIVLGARIATGVTGGALLLVLGVILWEQRRRPAGLEIEIPRSRAE